MSSLPQQTCRLNSASIVVVLFGLLLMKFSAAAPAFATTTVAAAVDSRNVNFSTNSTPSSSSEDSNLILLYEDSHFKGMRHFKKVFKKVLNQVTPKIYSTGIRSRLHVGESTCVNLMGKLNDFFSSVDPMGGCYLLCEHLNCRGRCVQISGKIPRLSVHGLNDCVSSLRSCEESSSGDDSSSSSSSSWFLRRKRRIRRSATKLKNSQEKLLGPSSSKTAVSSPFSSDLSNFNGQQRRTRRDLQANRGLASKRTGNYDLSADNSSRIVVSSSSPVTSSAPEQLSREIQRRRGSTDEKNGNYNSRYTDTLIRRSNHTEVERTTPHTLHLHEQRLLRISRYRRKRKELIVK